MDTKEKIDIMQSDFTIEGLDDNANEIVVSQAISDIQQCENFSDDEMKQINEVAGTIDLHDTNTIISYGAGAQKRLSSFSDAALDSVKTKDMNEIGDLLGGIVADLKYDPNESKGVFGFFKKGKNKIENVKAHYAKVGTNVESITKQLEGHQRILMKDIAMLDQLFEKNKVYHKEISMYIAAGKIALEKALTEELPALNQKAQLSGKQEDVQTAQDFAAMCDRFDKKLNDLEITRTICLQNAPQIRLVQNNDIVMNDKIHSTIVNAIPLWKNQMVIALGLIHSQEAVKAQRMVTDATNDLLRENAERLRTTTTETARENERSIVDMETLKYTNEQLIATLDDLVKIQADGRAKRRAAEEELANIEMKLKEKMLEVASGQVSG